MRGMRRLNNDYIKEGDSRRLAADVDEFLATGGTIEEVEFGVYGEKRVGLTKRQSLVMKQKDPNAVLA